MYGYRTLAALAATLVCVQLPAISAADAAASDDELYPPVSDQRCASVRAGERFEFQGRTILETPDITEPDLRRANALLSAKCFQQAEELVSRFAEASPDDHRVFFLHARMAWIYGQRDRAEAIVTTARQLHPDFTSATVLLASMRIEDRDFKAAQQLLDEVERSQPHDMWAFMGRLRIEAMVLPTKATAQKVRAIVQDPRFPPSARMTAYHLAKYELRLSDEERNELLATIVRMDTPGADCVIASRATELIELESKPRAGAQLLEDFIRKQGACAATPDVRALLAEAYLLQAAAIAPGAVRANAELRRRASEALGGDLTPLARRVAQRPFLAPLIPFLKGAVDPRQQDAYGYTVICSAVLALNPAMVTAELNNGADPGGFCDGHSLVMRIVLMATREKVKERQDALRTLLLRGAKVEGLEYCASPDNGDCSRVLLPILQEFESRRSQTRTTI